MADEPQGSLLGVVLDLGGATMLAKSTAHGVVRVLMPNAHKSNRARVVWRPCCPQGIGCGCVELCRAGRL